eukprot:TRINITY_DN20266_c0_g1_i4.p1 TRINITY_DN20266_c0_g1~~TRINITY_DN20266_c0_g1_i4.p1  ORF type:complete len:545 (+),score=76.95 TRINITY_DN20266_c0_g1_i4:127-1761(+)
MRHHSHRCLLTTGVIAALAGLEAAQTLDDFENEGQLECFGDGIFTFDECCNVDSYGPEGNPDCWDSTYTFQKCCSTPTEIRSFSNSKCWAGPAARINAEGPKAARQQLRSEASLEKFCCALKHNALCWGEKEEMVQGDDPPGEILGFSKSYAHCCFSKLKDLLERKHPPAWMAAGVARDMAPFVQRQAKRLRLEDLDAFEANLGPENRSKYCRFRISASGTIQHCDFNISRYFVLLEALRNTLHILKLVAQSLPQVDFIVAVEEAMCIFDQRLNKSSPADISIPIFAQAKPRKGCLNGVLMPWWASLNLDWARRYSEGIQQQGQEVPWMKRSARLFWRGSDTGCLLPGTCGGFKRRSLRSRVEGAADINDVNASCTCSEWNLESWHLFPRSRLTLLSSLYSAVDAKYTNTVHKDCDAAYKAGGLHVNRIVPPKDALWYRFLMYIDGTSFSDRLIWLLRSGAAIFKADSNIRVWLDAGLRPREHFVRVREDLSDLVDVVQWAQDHDSECEQIASRAQRFAETDLSLDASLYYFHYLLSSYARLFV